MADKLTINDWSETPSDNDNIAGVPLREGVTYPSHVNNAFREMMAQVKVALGKVDTRRNRMVNGDKLVSQENGQTAGTTNGRYISDQNAMYFVSSAGVFTGVNVQALSPAGGYRDRITITTADAALAAGEYLTYTQNIEGSSVRDLKWGTASASPIVVRFGFKGPAGTYAMALHNNGVARSYVALFTISAGQANTDTLQTFAVPGDVSGTWLSADGVVGLTIDVVLAAGSTFQGGAGWQGGNILGTSGVSNGLATAGAVFEFFDFGLRADPNATGVYGAYEVGVTDGRYSHLRYVELITASGIGNIISTQTGNGAESVAYVRIFEKCKVPALAFLSGGSWTAGAPTPYPTKDGVTWYQLSGRFFTASATVFVNARLS